MSKLPKSIAKRRRELLSQIRKTADDAVKEKLETELAGHLAPYKERLTRNP